MVFYGDRAPTPSELADAFESYIKVEDVEDNGKPLPTRETEDLFVYSFFPTTALVEDVPPTRAEMKASLETYQVVANGDGSELPGVDDLQPTATMMAAALAAYDSDEGRAVRATNNPSPSLIFVSAVNVEDREDVKPQAPVIPVIPAEEAVVAHREIRKSTRLAVRPAKVMPQQISRPRKAKGSAYRYNPRKEWPAKRIIKETARHFEVLFCDSLVTPGELKFWKRSVLSQKAARADGRMWVKWKPCKEKKGDVGQGLVTAFK
ncbi:hypothetical protein P7C70_g4039, partial [Phenoliferia sp. Uapishka_3]